MKVLLFAYEFPPVLSAQSLRWYYLANELVKVGVELDVLTPSFRDIWGFSPGFDTSLSIYRCFPGPFIGFSGWIGSCRRASHVSDNSSLTLDKLVHPRSLSIPERLYRAVRRGLDQVLFPDLRTEWLPFAWRAARRLNAAKHYDLVISSHEPGVDLLLGLRAQYDWGIPWIVDLADPLVAPYTPRWRVRWDQSLEGRVCHRADAILVTTRAVKTLLADRHGIALERFTLIRQGFDQYWQDNQATPPPPWPKDHLVLLFTGTLYPGFRDPAPLVEALAGLKGVFTLFVGDTGPFTEDLIRLGGRVLLLGKLPHAVCLAWQRQADVLVNIGNRQDDQVPGKIYEYLGACRPILHIASSATDPVPALLASLRRGRGVHADAQAIANLIREYQVLWRKGTLEQSFDLSLDAVSDYSWTAQARHVHGLMRTLLSGTGTFETAKDDPG